MKGKKLYERHIGCYAHRGSAANVNNAKLTSSCTKISLLLLFKYAYI